MQISSYLIKDEDGNDITNIQIPVEEETVTQSLTQLHRTYNILGLLHSKRVNEPDVYRHIVYKFMKCV